MKYKITRTRSNRAFFRRIVVEIESLNSIEFDIKEDSQGFLQIYLNTDISKNPSNNNFPKKWIKYKFDSKSNFFKQAVIYHSRVHQISLHPIDKIEKTNFRRTHLHFHDGTKICIPGPNIDEMCKGIIHFVKELNDQTYLNFSLVQNFSKEERDKMNKNIMFDLIKQEKLDPNSYIHRLNEFELDLLLSQDFHKIQSYGMESQNGHRWLEDFNMAFRDEMNGQRSTNFDITKNYSFHISHIVGRDEIESKKNSLVEKSWTLCL